MYSCKIEFCIFKSVSKSLNTYSVVYQIHFQYECFGRLSLFSANSISTIHFLCLAENSIEIIVVINSSYCWIYEICWLYCLWLTKMISNLNNSDSKMFVKILTSLSWPFIASDIDKHTWIFINIFSQLHFLCELYVNTEFHIHSSFGKTCQFQKYFAKMLTERMRKRHKSNDFSFQIRVVVYILYSQSISVNYLQGKSRYLVTNLKDAQAFFGQEKTFLKD